MKSKSPLASHLLSTRLAPLARATLAALLLGLGACGGGSEEQTDRGSGTEAAFNPTTTPLGNFNVKCDQSPAQQVQQQSPYQQQQIGSCSPQFQFYSSVATHFDVDLDCRRGRVQVSGKGLDQSSSFIPIQYDGSWRGRVVVNQSVENDGRGNLFCKVKTIVRFDGRASCRRGEEELSWGTMVDFASSESAFEEGYSRVASLMASPSPSVPVSSDPFESDPIGNDPGETAPSVVPVVSPTSDLEPGIATPTPSASPSPTPSVSPSACTFSKPENANAPALHISIHSGASDLGCNAFGSGSYSIAAGTAVTWTNNDHQPHTVTADLGGGEVFDSGPIEPGQSYTHVFNTVGSYNYHSALDANMQGLVVVRQGETSAPSPTASPVATPTATVPTELIPLPSPSPIPHPSPSVSPKPSPQPFPPLPPPPPKPPSVTQIVSCVIVNPCPVFAQTTHKCPLPAQQ